MSCVLPTPRVLAAAAHTDGSVDPIDIPKLAKMAQVQVTEQEVSDPEDTCVLACMRQQQQQQGRSKLPWQQ
jgi:hypothetical protein